MAQKPEVVAWTAMFELVTEGEAHSRLNDVARGLSLPVSLLRAALLLDRRQATSMRELAQHFGVDASYCTALVDGLESQGLACRGRHPVDRRVRTVTLTERGRSLLADARRRLGRSPPALGALTPDEQRLLAELLAKVVAADPFLAVGGGALSADRRRGRTREGRPRSSPGPARRTPAPPPG